jgi:hypothetical protein
MHKEFVGKELKSAPKDSEIVKADTPIKIRRLRVP